MTAGSSTWIDEWWAGQLAEVRAARLTAEAQDPGVPAWYGTALSRTSYHPWSAVAGARHRIPDVFNLDRLHRAVLALNGVTPA